MIDNSFDKIDIKFNDLERVYDIYKFIIKEYNKS